MTDLSIDGRHLIEILEEQRSLMQTLLEAMQSERSSFVSAKPSVLERVSTCLLPIAERLAELEKNRQKLTNEIRTALQLEGDLSVSALAPRLPNRLGNHLMQTAKAIEKLAKNLRVEQAVGNQLLNFSNQAQEGMCRDLMGLNDEHAPGYDRNAKTLKNLPGRGQLISGLI